ncbi:hypothetical protein HGB07_02560, partial [Candidatus Roizmanbacteria bacterium]|nr:hypothetical protein [Candidatus Roizmanbacteria bacterium]
YPTIYAPPYTQPPLQISTTNETLSGSAGPVASLESVCPQNVPANSCRQMSDTGISSFKVPENTEVKYSLGGDPTSMVYNNILSGIVTLDLQAQERNELNKGIDRYEIFLDRQLLFTQPTHVEVNAPHVRDTYLLNTSTLCNGTHELYIRAYDTQGLSSSGEYPSIAEKLPEYFPLLINTSNKTAQRCAGTTHIPANPPLFSHSIFQPTQSVITIFAAGTPADSVYPTMKLKIKNKTVKTWKNVKGDALRSIFAQYQYESPTKVSINDVRIEYGNDKKSELGGDRNLRVNKVDIDGAVYYTQSSSVLSSGSWSNENGCEPGFKRSEWLNCNGYFQF